MNIRPLVQTEYETLDWGDGWLGEKIVRLRTDMDGSCFFHALAKAYCRAYIDEKDGDLTINRREFVKSLRKNLAEKLEQYDRNGKTYYENLAKGTMTDQVKDLKDEGEPFTLKGLQRELTSNEPTGYVLNEFISDIIDKDIYLLSAEEKDVYSTGTDMELLYKYRPSIIILVLPGHYELIGSFEDDKIRTLFPADHDLIKKIRNRLRQLSTP